MKSAGAVLVAAAGLACALAAMPAQAAKEPPKCAKIEFRPVPSGMTDGEQDAGVYKSRFGKLEVRASVKQGEPENYYVVVKGQQPAAATGNLPASAEQCAREKKVGAPGKPVDKCTGQKLATVIDSAGQKKLILLYALQGREWKFCRAGTV
jgi:uncharacterized protein with FMN-binding domain